MSGIIAVYSLVIAVLIASDIGPPPNQHYSLFNGFMHLACGLSVGLTGLAAGYAIGIVGDMGTNCGIDSQHEEQRIDDEGFRTLITDTKKRPAEGKECAEYCLSKRGSLHC
ncbi:V-type proton ATPase 16 kDa proteolipid subunit 2 [Lachnellula cervina]|uniref:V-type proton ATPase 16 kDa proteolipid subunit 2 n=1 Tax=Lachnellula cervina TaxID=1316786 RepID=A0A7D8YT08_9HELO|nr:V-type proton ATPase 16 kDa proteolipid subunit 2 [Lachnellula cervina]